MEKAQTQLLRLYQQKYFKPEVLRRKNTDTPSSAQLQQPYRHMKAYFKQNRKTAYSNSHYYRDSNRLQQRTVYQQKEVGASGSIFVKEMPYDLVKLPAKSPVLIQKQEKKSTSGVIDQFKRGVNSISGPLVKSMRVRQLVQQSHRQIKVMHSSLGGQKTFRLLLEQHYSQKKQENQYKQQQRRYQIKVDRIKKNQSGFEPICTQKQVKRSWVRKARRRKENVQVSIEGQGRTVQPWLVKETEPF